MFKAGLIQVGILAGITACALLSDISKNNTKHDRQLATVTEESKAHLADFNYDLTNIPTFDEGQKIYNSLATELEHDFALQCGNRAHVWSWQMKKNFNINSGKIFLYFTPKSFNYTGMLWGVHVVPYVVIDGKEYVMEKIREYALGTKGYYLKKNLLFTGPVLLSDWLQKLTGFSECKVLSIANPADRGLHMLFKDVWQIKSDENCILQKTPMEYVWPLDVYNKVNTGFNPITINQSNALEACSYSMTGKKKKNRIENCESIL